MRRELFLGDVHTDLSKQEVYRPTGYQQPLLNTKYVNDCGVCGLVGRSNERSPAHLHSGPELPLLLAGSWASHRCETRPYGMFLTRHIIFSPTDNDWKMTLRYYHDPECSRPSFTLAAHGSYIRAAPSPYAYDFHVSRMVLTPDDSDLANALNSYKGKECGRPGSWETGKAQDITPTGGCQAVGVRVPVVEKEILRSGVNEDGGMWLALGQTATTPIQVGGLARPTSWGPQLVRCRHYSPRDLDNNLQPMVGARTAYSAAHNHAQSLFSIVFVCLIVAIRAP
ncbi:protein APCDD1-like [Penaeus japonicus]|uniref:protein APCDD1-like n=1 Tax=Penaeus japonicus TaxID=27405 RepID=UPI001C70F697|nr:protein APCDD1-like [Penaeus japonicus]